MLFNKDTGWQIGSVSACGIQPLQVIYERAARLLHYRPRSYSVKGDKSSPPPLKLQLQAFCFSGILLLFDKGIKYEENLIMSSVLQLIYQVSICAFVLQSLQNMFKGRWVGNASSLSFKL